MRRSWVSLRRADLNVFLDVVVVLCIYAVLFVAMSFTESGLVRVVTGSLGLVLLPGYGLTTVAFPSRSKIGGIERLALSFGTSIALLPLLGLLLWVSPLNVTPFGVFLLTAITAVGLVILSVARRLALPDENRFEIRYRQTPKRVTSSLKRPSRPETALNVVLLVAAIFAVGTLFTPFVAPQEGSTLTELSLLTENQTGEVVASGYPTEFTQNESETLIFNVENHERANTTYTVVLQEKKLNGENEVVQRTEIDRFRNRVPPGATWRVRHSVAPQIVGDRIRLSYLLYKGSPPSEPTAENAYRHAYFSINVSEE